MVLILKFKRVIELILFNANLYILINQVKTVIYYKHKMYHILIKYSRIINII
jgi:hypothetical protein